MFRSVLVPLDRSALAECVLPHALAAAQTFGAGLILLHVLDATAHAPAPANRGVQPLEWQLQHAEAERYLEAVARRLQLECADSPLDVRWVVLEGVTAEAIVQFAQTVSNSLIVLSSHGQSSLAGWIVSNVTRKVALRAPASLLIVRVHRDVGEAKPVVRYERVLLPLDGSQRAECVLSIASQIANWHGSEIVLVHVVPRPEMPRRMPISPEEATLVEALTERNRVACEQYFEDMRVRLSVPTRSHIIVSHHVGTTLQEVVSHESADLVIMSAHGYSGQFNWPFGNVARNFLEFGTTHVLIVKDGHFVPPAPLPLQTETAPRVHIPMGHGAGGGQ